MSNLAINLVRAARRVPDRAALISDTAVMSYAELDSAAARLATLLHRNGIGIGDRVGVMAPNIAMAPIAYYGIWRIGAIAIPMNPLMQAREVGFYLSNTGARALIGTPGFAAAATAAAEATEAKLWLVDDAELGRLTGDLAEFGDPVERAGTDTAVVLHTSGTTGKPKGAELTHGSLGSNQDVVMRLLKLTEDDVVLGCLPLFHVFGMTCAMNAAISAGATLSLLARFDPARAVERISHDRVSVFEGVPTMFSALLSVAGQFQPEATESLRICVSGGAAMPVAVLDEFEEAFDAIVLEGYGLSETSPAVSFNQPDTQRKAGSIGTPIEGVQMRLVDDAGMEVPAGTRGEIEVKGPNVMKGYWNLPDATAAAIRDGWFATGDIGVVDADGYYYVVDRKKELIIRGGYNVYPREVEEALREHPAVAAAVVVGMPHDSLGEEVGAAVMLKNGAAVSAEELRQFAKERVAAYKYPRRIWFVDSLPTGPTGKVLRREVKPPPDEEG
ncbi:MULTISPECIES: long-chain fatty acid--CoA ligase [unclassified Mycolicibacterium]|uniref:long-chain-fatty-acid--CoA ligase n=1 Tax=unclassified Mycolicibacterium TaxID=2636767 RepID=UPI0012DF269C|nr:MULTISPECIES: long-chain fatty acid--CoA ligase [unclassified Mycolicibacterium]MUL80243.1 long-chain fatty acid--CoA ligase [Mycolicibacterium sp. CBMA 329]MUL86010.1 long-chain fatty acid--CoA ligase [Mycolicibacterium sp. CBMA 331]MUM00784.1 long-chain fatty acid--CoA ligase [Mycolicibacterium sp. CBMA 334]MUM28206.1 long-chain fatty acid--CoA ligase [Mycolicibacterium sp. CBMA 295]MUM36306.1 long-chain fatty acid--CoA ligase [Mycolicibacterium sp. CBMA 247]